MGIVGENIITIIYKHDNFLYFCDFLMDFCKLSFIVIVKAYYSWMLQ